MNEQELRETEARLVGAAMVSADVARELVAEVRRLQAENAELRKTYYDGVMRLAAELIIDRTPLTDDDTKRTGELIRMHNWNGEGVA